MGPSGRRTCLEGSDPHPVAVVRLLSEDRTSFGLQFVKTNFIQTELSPVVNLSINVTHVVV